MSDFTFNPHTHDYDANNAHALAQLAALAYSTRAAIKRKIKAWGFDEDNFEFFDSKDTDTQGFAVLNDDCIIVAFRGTEPLLADWLGDLKIHLTGGPLGKVHEGFAADLNAVWLDVLQFLRDVPTGRTRPRTLWLTGHSLGAAVATLATAKLVERGEPVDGLYTFGSPRCGDSTFATAFNAQFPRTWRIVNRNDSVTRVPPRPLYDHVGSVKYIDENGMLQGEDGWQAFLRSIRFTLEDLRQLKPGAIKDHATEDYIVALDKLRMPAVAPGA